MNDCRNTSNNDCSVINDITFDELMFSQHATSYSMMFFCIRLNRSNKLALRVFGFIYNLIGKECFSYKEFIWHFVNVVIVILCLLISIFVVSIIVAKVDFVLILVYNIPIILILYACIQITIDSFNAITLKVADFQLRTSEIKKDLGVYNNLLIRHFIVNKSSNNYGLVYIQQKSNSSSNDTSFIKRLLPFSLVISFIKRLLPFSLVISFYKRICQYMRYVNIINTYYFKKRNIDYLYDDKDRYCINNLNNITSQIIEMHNEKVIVDRIVIFRGVTPIYCCDVKDEPMKLYVKDGSRKRFLKYFLDKLN